jgi:hypothetical protein
MVEIGLGRRPDNDMTRLLQLTHNADTGTLAPPQGLHFVAATYPDLIYLGEEAAW